LETLETSSIKLKMNSFYVPLSNLIWLQHKSSYLNREETIFLKSEACRAVGFLRRGELICRGLLLYPMSTSELAVPGGSVPV